MGIFAVRCFAFVVFLSILSIVINAQSILNQQKNEPRLLESFGKVSPDDGNAKVDYLSNEVINSTESRGYIIIYGGQFGKKGEVEAHIKAFKVVFLFKNIDEKTMVFVKGGFRKKFTIEFWVVPKGACPPYPTPTIDFEKVKLKGIAKKVYYTSP
jgi:hypothetical protein